MPMIENHISGNLYNEIFSEGSEEKFMAFQGMAWSLIIQKNTIKNILNNLFCKEKSNVLVLIHICFKFDFKFE